MNRRGVTLIELLVALALSALVATAVLQTLVGTQRISHAGTQRIDVQQNLRAGLGYLGTALRELNAADSDITVATDTKLAFRTMRWFGIMCAAPAAGPGTTVVLPVRQSPLFGLRQPNPNEDSVLVFQELDASTRSDDTWLVGALLATANGVCLDGSAATLLTAEMTAASGGAAAVFAGVTAGAPIRGFQQEELSLFQGADSRWWMGQRTADRSGTWTGVQPLIGPLTAMGLRFEYFDSTGAVTAVRTAIASVEVAMQAQSRERVRQRIANIDYTHDSLVTRIALRNNPRF